MCRVGEGCRVRDVGCGVRDVGCRVRDGVRDSTTRTTLIGQEEWIDKCQSSFLTSPKRGCGTLLVFV